MTSRSSQLFAAAQKRIPGGVNSPVRAFRNVGSAPFFVARAEGAKIWDVDGKEYIDYVGSWGPAILGHAPKVVVDAVREAATRGVSFGIPNPLEVEMARTIVDWVPSIEKVRMVNSGTEATMSCIRLARGFTGRDKIVKFDGCYHGHADALLVKAGSGALTHGQPSSAGVPSAFADLTISLPLNNAELMRKAFQENKNEIAAVIIEPIPANAGLYFPRENFLSILREECTSNDALLIFDEVITGFRVARGGAEIMDQLSPDGPVYQAGTLSGNPIAMAAGLAQLRELERIDGWKLLDELGAHFEKLARDAIAKAKPDITFHRLGSMFCSFFAAGPIVDLAGAQRSDLKMFARFFHACSERGIYFAPSQFETGFISTAHTPEDIEQTGVAMSGALAQL